MGERDRVDENLGWQLERETLGQRDDYRLGDVVRVALVPRAAALDEGRPGREIVTSPALSPPPARAAGA